MAEGYIDIIQKKFMESIMHTFYVTKITDIQMVYDRSKLGLNAAICAPWFALPTAKSMTW